MTIPKLLAGVLGTLLLASASALHAPRFVGPQLEQQLKATDQVKLSKAVRGYFEVNMGKSSGLLESVEKVQKELDALEKKYNKKGEGTPVQAMVADLQQVFLLATDRPGKESGKCRGKIGEFEFEGHFGDEIPYAVHAPKKYNEGKAEKAGGLALVLIIPDAGENLRDHLDTYWMDDALRDEAILVAVGMPENISMWSETGSSNKPGGRGSLLQVYKRISESFIVDTNRVFLAGRGAGVAAAVKIAEGSPSTYAGVIGRAGDMNETSPKNFLHVPTFFQGGAENVTAFHAAAKELGMENVTVAPDAATEDITAWIAGQVRNPFPDRIVFAPASQRLKRSYWLNLASFEPDGVAQIEAVVDRDSNTVTVTATGVSSIVIELNDTLVDLGKPVKIVCNGVTQEDSFQRSFRMAMDQVFKSADPSRVVVASKRYDVPVQ